MALPASDSFTDSDFTTLPSHDANWVINDGSYYIVSNGAYGNSADNLAAWTGDTFAADQYSEIIIQAATTFVYTGVAVHIATDASANAYYLYGSSGGATIGGEVVTGTWTDTSGSGANVVATDVLTLEVTVSGGTATLVPKLNAVEITAITPWTSTAHTSGDAGLAHKGADSNSRADSWVGDDLAASVTAALTGTMTASVDEDDITTGGKTVIVTLVGDTWKAAGTGPIGSTADTQALIDGFDAASSPTNGWNNEVRDKALTSEVVRTSSTIATWTVGAQAGYDISAQETITGTIPTAALTTGAGALTATPTFTVDQVTAGVSGSHSLLGVGF